MRELEELAAALTARGARDEALGIWTERRVLGVARPPVIVPTGRVWRLGALLLDVTGGLYALGRVTRALEPRDYNSDKTVAGEERREEQRAAVRGGYRSGETVNFDYEPIDPAAPTPPLVIEDGALAILDGSVHMSLLRYLQDRADLLPGA